MDVQVKEGYYVTEKYASLERFIGYFYQVDAIRRLKHKKLLLIGVGDGIVPHFLRAAGLEVVTLDFDPELQPDLVGDICELPVADKSFDLVCAFEVLEHLPFDKTKKALAEMERVSRKGAVVSVPHRRTGVELVLKLPFMRSLLKRDYVRAALRVPVRFPGFAVSKQHYWEIDGRGMTLKNFRKTLREHFEIISEETPVLDMYRRFFVLKKVGS